MQSHAVAPRFARPRVTIRVSGKLFQGHLTCLDRLVASADECRLWPVLNLATIDELDRAAILYLVERENREFGISACPNFVREWMEHERRRFSAA